MLNEFKEELQILTAKNIIDSAINKIYEEFEHATDEKKSKLLSNKIEVLKNYRQEVNEGNKRAINKIIESHKNNIL